MTCLGAHLALTPLLEGVQLEWRAGLAQARAAQALADAEQSLQAARSRLDADLTFPAAGCANGLCANLAAPMADSYDWSRGAVHQGLPGIAGGGWWIESLGFVNAGATAGDCSGSSGGCEYVRVTASAAPAGMRRSLEAVYRIRRMAGSPPGVARISWRQSTAP